MVHFGICLAGPLAEYVYANIFDISGLTDRHSCSSEEHLKQADPHVPFVCSHHGVSGQEDWTASTDLQAPKYLNSLRPSDPSIMVTKPTSTLNLRPSDPSMVTKFWSPVLQQSGTKPNLVAKILATSFGVFFVKYVMFLKICSIWV